MTVAAQLAHVDEEIAKQIGSLCDLRTQRNTLPVSRLAIETLETIFICYARDYHSTHDGSRTATAPSWVNVSYLCRHWRSVAVNCSTLWSYLFVTSPRWTDELLARSKKASLKIRAKAYPVAAIEIGRWFVAQVFNHMERIQELHLGLPMCLDNHSFSNLSLPAPRLQNLILPFGMYRRKPSQRPRVLFDGDTPALRILELSSCPEPWYLFKLTGLTTLNLYDIPNEFQQNTMEFLTTLSSMQGLTHLYLRDSLASATSVLSSPELHTFQKFDLPYLSRLLVAAPFSTVIVLLACIHIPVKTEVMLDCHFEGGFVLHDHASLFLGLAQRFSTIARALSSSPFRSLIIESATSRQAQLTFSLLECDRDAFGPTLEQGWSCNIPLKIKVCLGSSSTNNGLDGILSDISSFVALLDIQSLHVVDPPLSSASWINVLEHFPDLRYLKLSSGDLPDLAPVFSFTGTTASKGTGGQNQSGDRDGHLMLTPGLEELHLHQISFRKSLKKDNDRHPVDVDALCDALATRKGSSGQVTITQCIECKVTARWTKETRFDMIRHWKEGRFCVVGRRGVKR